MTQNISENYKDYKKVMISFGGVNYKKNWKNHNQTNLEILRWKV